MVAYLLVVVRENGNIEVPEVYADRQAAENAVGRWLELKRSGVALFDYCHVAERPYFQ